MNVMSFCTSLCLTVDHVKLLEHLFTMISTKQLTVPDLTNLSSMLRTLPVELNDSDDKSKRCNTEAKRIKLDVHAGDNSCAKI